MLLLYLLKIVLYLNEELPQGEQTVLIDTRRIESPIRSIGFSYYTSLQFTRGIHDSYMFAYIQYTCTEKVNNIRNSRY